MIPWHVKTDIQRVALQEADSRTLMSVAEVRFKAFQSNVPDLGILGHVVEPMKVTKDWDFPNGTFSQCNIFPVDQFPNGKFSQLNAIEHFRNGTFSHWITFPIEQFPNG